MSTTKKKLTTTDKQFRLTFFSNFSMHIIYHRPCSSSAWPCYGQHCLPPYLQFALEGNVQMSIILNRLFLAVWLDECSFIDSDEIREAAYAASLLYSAPKMRDFCPTIEELPLVVRSTWELQNTVSSLRARGVQSIDLATRIMAYRNALLRVTSLTPNYGLPSYKPYSAEQSWFPSPLVHNPVHQALTPSETAKRRQGITNLTCRDSGLHL